jgi:hypothetical protein
MNSQLELFTPQALPGSSPLYPMGTAVVWQLAPGYPPQQGIVTDASFNESVASPRYFYDVASTSAQGRTIGLSESQLKPLETPGEFISAYKRQLAIKARADFHTLGKWMDQKTPSARRRWQDARALADRLAAA